MVLHRHLKCQQLGLFKYMLKASSNFWGSHAKREIAKCSIRPAQWVSPFVHCIFQQLAKTQKLYVKDTSTDKLNQFVEWM